MFCPGRTFDLLAEFLVSLCVQCTGCSNDCPHCAAQHPKGTDGKPCAALPPRPGCKSLIPGVALIPQYGFRDPTTPYLAPCSKGALSQCWFAVFGSGTEKNRSATGLLFRSRSDTDVTSKWTFVSVLIRENAAAGCISDQYQYSCPDWFKLGASWVWMSLYPDWNLGDAHTANIYFTGTLDESAMKFVASESTPLFPPSPAGYKRFGHTISKSGANSEGRRIQWGAICKNTGADFSFPNPKSKLDRASKTHHGCTMSLGVELSIAEGPARGLEFHFLPELRDLRREQIPAHVGGRLLEIIANISTGSSANGRHNNATKYGLTLFGGCVTLTYDATKGELAFGGNATLVDARDGIGVAHRVAVPFMLAPTELLRLHVYLDGSVAEAIANNRAQVATIVAPPSGPQWQVVGSVPTGAANMQLWSLEPTVQFDQPPIDQRDDVMKKN
eukprot:SAG31_NODE_794_length_12043_cov_7.416192_4_plen_444_part_00